MGTSHGMSRTPEYRAWLNLIQRCENPREKDFHHYGGRGISVWPEWRASFAVFFTAVGRRPSPRHSLDRIDNDRGYEPGNVRWATQSEQMRNTSRTVPGCSDEPSGMFAFRVSVSLRAEMKAAAKARGMRVSDWLREAVTAAARTPT